MTVKTFPYPGIKYHLLKYMPAKIEGDFYDLFVGSGLVSYNVAVSRKHYCVDLDPIVILLHNAIKRFQWSAMDKYQTYVTKRWDLARKDDYYAYRDWFNHTLWESNHEKKGLGFLLLARSCLNGLLRLGPNGFNQSSGKRFSPFTEETWSRLHWRSQSIQFVYDDFRNVPIQKGSFVYADPPYLINAVSTYGKHWRESDLRDTLAMCQEHTFWYTDTTNKVNRLFLERHKGLTKIPLRPMRIQSPGAKQAQVLSGKTEILVTNWFSQATSQV